MNSAKTILIEVIHYIKIEVTKYVIAISILIYSIIYLLNEVLSRIENIETKNLYSMLISIAVGISSIIYLKIVKTENKVKKNHNTNYSLVENFILGSAKGIRDDQK